MNYYRFLHVQTLSSYYCIPLERFPEITKRIKNDIKILFQVIKKNIEIDQRFLEGFQNNWTKLLGENNKRCIWEIYNCLLKICENSFSEPVVVSTYDEDYNTSIEIFQGSKSLNLFKISFTKDNPFSS